ncbi:MAG: CRISPR system precrRNA processing endoribonuclease RAMP protein Cas6 [Anaerolineae bacterium]
MLASFVVSMRPYREAPIGRTIGRSLHALLLNMLVEVNPAMAQAFHDDAPVKPFTVSMLQGRFTERGYRRFVRPDETYRVRYTVLAVELFEALSYILFEKQLDREAVIIDGHPYQLVDINAEPEVTDGWGRLASFEQMMEEAGIADKLILEFRSPTTFRQGKLQLLFPLPENVFGSYLRRWNGTAPVDLDASKVLDAAVAHVVAERYRLETRVVPYGEAQYNGFVGYCQYRILTDDIETRRVFNLLADFALFAGTGQKTTQGMGQTRRLAELPRPSFA